MAKKKQSKKSQPPSEPTPQRPSETAVTVDDSSEQLKLLRAFNGKLIKHTADGRDLIERLRQEKMSLEAQLATEAGLVESLQAEKSELASMKERWRLASEEAEKLRARCEGLVLEREAGEETIKRLESDNRSIATELNDLVFVVDGLKAQNNSCLKEKSDLEARIGALENELGAESEIASGLRADLKALQTKNSEMERFVADKVSKKEAEIVGLKNANAKKEMLLDNLEFNLTEAVTRWKRSSSEKVEKYEELVREKSQAEEARVLLEAATIRLSNEVGELRDALFGSRKSCRDEEGKNEKLISEFESLKKAFERAKKESQTARNALEEEQSNAEFLKRALSEKETLVEERTRELFASKTEIKNRDSEIAELKDEVGKLGKMVAGEEEKLSEEGSPYFSELEAIQKAFREKEKAVEAMKAQVEALKQSTAEANRKKSFWTWVSSATTLFAAAAVAYAAKGQR